jgi:hypothetical protein
MTAYHHEANAMPPQETITVALAILSTLILIRLLLPNLFAVLGLIGLTNGFAGGPEDANSYWPSKMDDDLYKEMLALGFQPEGTYWEQLPFTRRFEEFVFTRPGEKCFGLLYPNSQIMPRRGSFLTVFETGGVVFTKNYCGGVEVQEGDFLVTGGRTDPARDLPPRPTAPAGSSWKPIAFGLAAAVLMATLVDGRDRWLSSDQRIMFWVLSGLAVIGTLLPIRPQDAPPRRPARQPVDLDLRIPLAETLARHRLNVNRLLAQGQQLPAVFDGNEFIATQQRYYRHPRLRRQRQSTMWTLLRVKLIMLAPLPTIFFCSLGVRDPLPWSVLLVEGLVGLYLRYGCSSARVLNILRGFRRDQRAS